MASEGPELKKRIILEGPQADDSGGGRLWRLILLVYLPIYFIPWAFRHPGPVELVASLAGLGLFLALFLNMMTYERPVRVWKVLTVYALGLALSAFSVGWSVYSIYAMAFAARIQPRPRAVALLVGLEAILAAAGAAVLLGWIHWTSIWDIGFAVGLGAATAVMGFSQVDLVRKNRELAAAQEEVRALAVTAERERISRDLHDLLGHTLTLVAVKAELAARLVSRDAAEAEREMQAVAEVAREALAEVRTAVADMHGASLATEVQRAVEMLKSANVSAEVSAPARLDDAQREAVLAMALREAVTNVIRHANASRCAIRLDVDGQGVRLTVRDDGAGGACIEGSGLRGMRARLAAVGGALELTSNTRGTQLLATLPAGAA